MGNYRFLKRGGTWHRKTADDEPWCRLVVETHRSTRRVLRNVGRNGQRYYDDVEDVVYVWVWEPTTLAGHVADRDRDPSGANRRAGR